MGPTDYVTASGLRSPSVGALFESVQTVRIASRFGYHISLSLGLWMIARPSTTAVPLSYVVGLAWLAIYAALTVQQSGELVAWTTDVFLALIGGASRRRKRWQ